MTIACHELIYIFLGSLEPKDICLEYFPIGATDHKEDR